MFLRGLFGEGWFLWGCLKEALEAAAKNTRGSNMRGWISEGAVLIEVVSARAVW